MSASAGKIRKAEPSKVKKSSRKGSSQRDRRLEQAVSAQSRLPGDAIDAAEDPSALGESRAQKVVEQGLESGAMPGILGFVCDATTGDAVTGFCASRGAASRIGPGGVAGAIEYLASEIGAPLLFVDFDDSPDPMADIDRLADLCEPGTTVVAIGSKNDIALYRDFLDAGVVDYLVKPLDGASLARAVEQARDATAPEDVETKHGELIFVVSARGGSGGSTVAVNTAWQISSRGEKRVVLVDLDLQFGTSALLLDIEPGRGLREMLDHPERIDTMFLASAASSVNQNLALLACEEPLDGDGYFSDESCLMLLSELQKAYDYVIVELPRALAVSKRIILSSGSSVVLVSDMTLAGMRDATRLNALFREEIPKLKRLIVANRVGGDKKHELPKAEFERGMEAKIDFLLPEDPKAVKGSQIAGKSVQAIAAKSKVVAVIDEICDALLADDDAEQDKKSKAPMKFRLPWSKG